MRADPELTRVAERFARELATRRKLETKNRDGETPIDLLKREGYRARQSGLSLATGESNPEEVVRLWLERREDREGVLATFDRIGVGIAADEDDVPYWVVLMAQTRPR